MALKGMACPEPPPMDRKVVGKMGLKGVPGFNYASADSFNGGRSHSRPKNNGRDVLSPGAGQGGHRGGVEKSSGRGRGGRGGRGRRGGGRGGRGKQ